MLAFIFRTEQIPVCHALGWYILTGFYSRICSSIQICIGKTIFRARHWHESLLPGAKQCFYHVVKASFTSAYDLKIFFPGKSLHCIRTLLKMFKSKRCHIKKNTTGDT
jgi:hypothetical protein